MSKIIRLLGSLSAMGLLLGTGCMDLGMKADKDKFALIQPGVTSRALIEQSFGPPDAVDTVGDHTVLLYSHLHAATGLLGITGSLDFDRQSYQFVLNSAGKVESSVLREYHGSSGIFGGPSKESLVPTSQPAMSPPTAPS